MYLLRLECESYLTGACHQTFNCTIDARLHCDKRGHAQAVSRRFLIAQVLIHSLVESLGFVIDRLAVGQIFPNTSHFLFSHDSNSTHILLSGVWKWTQKRPLFRETHSHPTRRK